MRPRSVVLLTGRPGVGKTTCLRRTLALLDVPAEGFFTEEIRESGARMGFALVTLGGERAILAHVARGSAPRVGKYGVNLEALDRVGVPAIRRALRQGRLVVIDEIGKMELAAPAFREVVGEALRAGVPMLGTILSGPHPWADAIKSNPLVHLVEVTAANRESLPRELAGRFAAVTERHRLGAGAGRQPAR